MIPCPECGSTSFMVGRMCPAHKGETVCSDCCKRCEYWNGERCSWHQFNESVQDKIEEEKEKLRNKISYKEKLIEKYYERSQPWIANKLTYEVAYLTRKLAELEKIK